MNRFACVVLIDRHGRLLLQERDEHPVIDPEKWGFCGGHLDEGEDALGGAVRELEEENRRLKKMYAEERLKAEIIQEAMAKKW